MNISNTTFASYYPGGAARDANGDMRLIPMAEILMRGAQTPLPTIAPSATQSFAGNGITGTLTIVLDSFAAQNSRLSVSLSTAGSVSMPIALGSCGDSTARTTHVFTCSDLFSFGERVTALASGRFVVNLSRTNSVTNSLCVPLVDIPNGMNADRMFDMSFFQPYGVSLRDVTTDTVIAYVPVNLVSDPLTRDRVAFAARMPYWPQDPTNWGTHHGVRLVWLLSLLQDGGGASVVHVYPEDWRLTGLTVREDCGMDMAVAFEQPTADDDLAYPNRLHASANGLESSFLANRDANGDCVRDLSIATIKSRFDAASNGAITAQQRWGLPQNAFSVQTYGFGSADELAKFGMSTLQTVLNSSFLNNGQPRTPNPMLLYARETRFRQMGLDDAAASSDNLLVLNLDPSQVRPQTLASLSWTPYRYQNGKWQDIPATEFVDIAGASFNTRFAASSDEVRPAEVMLMQGVYAALMNGTTANLQVFGDSPQAPEAAQDDSQISAVASNIAGSSPAVTGAYLGPLAELALSEASSLANVRSLNKALPFAGDLDTAGVTAKKAITKAFKKLGGDWSKTFNLGGIKKYAGPNAKINGKAAAALAVGAMAVTVTLIVLGARDGGGGQAVFGAIRLR